MTDCGGRWPIQRQQCRCVAWVVAAAITVLSLVPPPVAAWSADGARCRSGYGPPVLAPIADGFRERNGRYGPGNRGIEYATDAGIVVSSVAGGEVLFAGPVVGRGVVTILHDDGLRSSYTGLAARLVHRGEIVGSCDPIGRTAGRLHLSVRAGSAYLDPAILFAEAARPPRPTARLVPITSPSRRSTNYPWPGPGLEDPSGLPI